MRLGRYTFRTTATCFIFLPANSKVTPLSFILIPPNYEIAVARNTFTPPSSKIIPMNYKVTPSSFKVTVARSNFTPPSSKNRETCFTFYPCFIGVVQLSV